MPITSDLRSYAESALEQGRQVLDQAQAQLTDVTGQANEFVGRLSDTAKNNVADLTVKASGTVSDLRSQAEKAVNIEAVKAAVEPYVAQAKEYTTAMTDRAEDLIANLKGDPRVIKLISTAEALTGVVVETVQERLVKPVQSLTGAGVKADPAPPAATPEPAASKPAAAKTTAPKATAAKAAPKPAAAAPATQAPTRKASAKKTTPSV